MSAGTLVIQEGGTTGHLYVLIEGRLEVLKGDTVVATLSEPGAVGLRGDNAEFEFSHFRVSELR